MNQLWSSILYLVIGLIIGAVASFFITRHIFQKNLKENPPINEKMVRAMFQQMGRKPSEAQIRSIMKTFGQQ